MVAVFERMKSEGLIPVIFHAIPMRNAGDFLALMKNPVNLPVFALSNTECIAFAWLNNITTNSAYGHFCHFKNDIDPVEIGKVITKHWFKFPIDIVLGSIPAFNMRAVKFMQKLGYVVVGEVPDLYKNPFTHEKCAAVIVYCRRPHG